MSTMESYIEGLAPESNAEAGGEAITQWEKDRIVLPDDAPPFI